MHALDIVAGIVEQRYSLPTISRYQISKSTSWRNTLTLRPQTPG
jgi:hypothetical protein